MSAEIIKFIFSKKVVIIMSSFTNEPETYSHVMRLTDTPLKLNFININIKNTSSEPLRKYSVYEKMSGKFILGSYYKIFIQI